jgi:hypothetical protein
MSPDWTKPLAGSYAITKEKQMLTTTYQNPLDVHTLIFRFGKRYTFWYLTEECGCSVSRTLYLMFLSF